MWKDDPGPCPVDDCPHTTCVSPDYQGRSDGAIVVVVEPDAPLHTILGDTSEIPPPAAPLPPQTFSTSTYRGMQPRNKMGPPPATFSGKPAATSQPQEKPDGNEKH